MRRPHRGQRGQDGPPHHDRRGQEHQVLDDVEVVVDERGVVGPREVPGHDRRREDRPSRERPRGPSRQAAHPRRTEQRLDHRRRRPVQQQRREDQHQHQVLHHMGAEQITVGEVVQRAVETDEQHRERGGERRDPAARGREPPQKHIEPAQHGEPDDNARVEIPAPPGVREGGGHRFSTNAPNRNMSPIVITMASSSGPPNRNVKKRLSILRCM